MIVATPGPRYSEVALLIVFMGLRRAQVVDVPLWTVKFETCLQVMIGVRV